MEEITKYGASKPTFIPVNLDDHTILRIEATQLDAEVINEEYIIGGVAFISTSAND